MLISTTDGQKILPPVSCWGNTVTFHYNLMIYTVSGKVRLYKEMQRGVRGCIFSIR